MARSNYRELEATATKFLKDHGCDEWGIPIDESHQEIVLQRQFENSMLTNGRFREGNKHRRRKR